MEGSGLTIFFVYSPMSLQGKSISERSRTDVALEGLQTRVYLFVIFEMCSLAKRGLATVALVGLFTGVDTPMVPEGGVPGKSFIADLANVRLFTTVCPFVILQMGGLGELHATRPTFVWLLSGMDSSMVL